MFKNNVILYGRESKPPKSSVLFFSEPKPNDIKNWVCVLQRSTEYEVEMAKNYLSDCDIPSNILSKRDTAYNFVISSISPVFLYVPEEYEQEARRVLAEWTDETKE